MKNRVAIPACVLLIAISGCGNGAVNPVSATAATKTGDYKACLNSLCDEIITAISAIETETNGDRVAEHGRRIKADYLNCPKVPTSNDNSDIIEDQSARVVGSFAVYCDQMATAITREKRDVADTAKSERRDAQIFRDAAQQSIEKLRSIMSETK